MVLTRARCVLVLALVVPTVIIAVATVHHRGSQQLASEVVSERTVCGLEKRTVGDEVKIVNASRSIGAGPESAVAGLLLPIWTISAATALFGALVAVNCVCLFKMAQAVRTVSKANVRPILSCKSSQMFRKTSVKGKGRKASRLRNCATPSSIASSNTRGSKDTDSSSEEWITISPQPITVQKCATMEGMDEPGSDNQSIIDDEVPTVMRTTLAERTLDRRIDRPMTEEEFMKAMRKVIEFIVDLYRNPAKHPVSTDMRPSDLFSLLPTAAPENPETFDVVWTDFYEIIFKKGIQWQHPQFHSFFPCGRSYPDILAETIISSLGNVGFNWSCNPTLAELDTAMVNWMGRALGIPEHFLFQGADTCESPGGGWIADTASDTIFCAVMAARHIKVQQELAKFNAEESESTDQTRTKHERTAEITSRLVAYGSYECHSSFEKACLMAGVYCRHVEVFAEDDYGMRRAEVERMIEKDVAAGLIPFYLQIALGTTSTATSDHLEELTGLKEKYDIWMHVDAAYAGSAWIVPSYRNNAGIDKIDSLNVNLHKFFLISTSVTLFWTTRQREYKECFRVHPVYLKKKAGGNDPRDWGIQLSRRFKSLKVYMLLRTYGINGMRAYVNRIIKMTEYMETLIVTIPNILKFGKTHYGLFCIQYHEEGMSQDEVNEATNSLWEFLNNSRKMLFTHSNVRGHDIIRVAVTLERSTEKDVEDSVAIFIQLLEKFQHLRKDRSTLGQFKNTGATDDCLVMT
ncbi:hypothetical protein PFISCL1PPCAC_13028 [Pristionchus fissidentatus]|uniref:Aromatic-L-amino-acid decarboxylase n=1 Tax=Pristionchus fissidentatus TaxID=1538716 RepID=A0AAV5VQL6_9BILA|nr:hypothetical protein PFISCL1PPCAC_13028 [Pristionchus fissidentatus]